MKGIMFKPDMITATIKGRKTNTRRVEAGLREINTNPDAHKYLGMIVLGEACFKFFLGDGLSTIKCIKPRYHIGETVYIKEAWATEKRYNHLKPSEIPHTATIFYVSDGVGEWPSNLSIGRLRSPLHLPEEFARHFIVIEQVRAERLQAMTWADCKAEGLEHDGLDARNVSVNFVFLWDSINPEYPWLSNPWVFPYTFRLKEDK